MSTSPCVLAASVCCVLAARVCCVLAASVCCVFRSLFRVRGMPPLFVKIRLPYTMS